MRSKPSRPIASRSGEKISLSLLARGLAWSSGMTTFLRKLLSEVREAFEVRLSESRAADVRWHVSNGCALGEGLALWEELTKDDWALPEAEGLQSSEALDVL